MLYNNNNATFSIFTFLNMESVANIPNNDDLQLCFLVGRTDNLVN